MKTLSARIFSVALAIVMAISSISFTSFAYAVPYQAGMNLPYLDTDTGKYYREHTDVNGVKHTLEFSTDFNDVIDCFRNSMLNRKKNFTIKFATKDPAFAFKTNEQAADNAVRLINNAMYGAFTTETSNPFGGDFLYHSINMSSGGFAPAYNHYDPAYDKLGQQQYYCYELGLENVDYYADVKSENYVEEFVKQFNKKYIDPQSDDYTKVKTIYDFVVRNSAYDFDVFEGKVSRTTAQFKRAHSAYGAISGKLVKSTSKNYNEMLADGSLTMPSHFDSHFSSVKTVEDENVSKKYNNGLAVCEGYSKLFYALCVSNGIKCHIVDGNYVDGVKDKNGKQKSDPHEWNYVYLKDYNDTSKKWYQIDTTYASQHSIKDIDYNSYEYFLVGSSNENMTKNKHQQPYELKKNAYGDVMLFDYDSSNDIEYQLYNWYSSTYKASVDDYDYPAFNLTNVKYADGDNVKNAVLVSRSYDVKGETRTAYVLYKREGVESFVLNVEISEDGIEYTETDAHGFPYRSLKDTTFTYTYMVPYVVNTDKLIVSSNQEKFVKAGTHTHKIGNDTTSSYLSINIPIVPLDMSGSPESGKNTNYSKAEISNNAHYSGDKIVPTATILDGFNTKLVEGRDYNINYYSDSAYKNKVSEIKNIGKYYISIDYKGNYTGKYRLVFNVGKASVNDIIFTKSTFAYLPKKMRSKNNINNVADYFINGYKDIKYGDYVINPGVDYSVKYSVSTGDSTGMDYGSTGKLVLTGLSSSKCITSGSKKTINYTISGKFDIGNSKNGFNGIPASSKTYTYTGKPIKPSTFDNINKVLASDEYRIASYSNCTNAGKAKVTVEGKGGCNGTAVMYYVINKKPITTDMVTINQVGKEIYVQLRYNGITLKPGTDYSVTKKADSLTIKSIDKGNYTGAYVINAKGIGKLKVKYGNIPQTVELAKTVLTYNGKSQKPSVIVKDSKGKKVSTKDYTVKYPKESKAIGEYTVTITFKGSYSGSVKRTFTVVPKGTSLNYVRSDKGAFVANWSKQTSNTTGYEIRYGTDTRMTDAKIVTVSKNKTTSKKVSKLKSNKMYYVQVRTYKTVNSKRITSEWSKAMAVTTK